MTYTSNVTIKARTENNMTSFWVRLNEDGHEVLAGSFINNACTHAEAEPREMWDAVATILFNRGKHDGETVEDAVLAAIELANEKRASMNIETDFD